METRPPPTPPPTPLRESPATRNGKKGDVNGVQHVALPGRPPMRVYTVDAPKKKRRWVRILLWFTGILVLLAAIAAGALYLYLRNAVDTITHTSNPVQKEAQKKLVTPAKGVAGQPRVALVVGEDQRPGDVSWRSDTMMLVRIDPKTKTMSILNFPRDLMVDIPGHGRQAINQAFAIGGEDLALQTVKNLTGITPNYLVPINFKGFEEIVNAFGGVWLEVDRRYYNKNLGTEATNFDEIDLMPGYRRLSGKQALDFARYRHSDSDIMRVGRQQAFMREFKKRLDIWTAAKSLIRLVGIAKDNIKILGAAGGGAPDTDTFIEYGQALGEVGGNIVSVQLSVVPAPEDPVNRVAVSPEELQRAVTEFRNPDPATAEKVTDRDVAKDPTKASVKPLFKKGTAKVEIRNGGSATDPIAGDVQYLLNTERGWRRATADGNADKADYLHTTIYADKTKAAQAIATALDKEFVGAHVEQLTADVRAKLETQNHVDAGVVLVVGRDWAGQLAPSLDSKLPDAEPAHLTDADPKRDLEEWKKLQKQAGIPLMMPTQLEVNMRANDPFPGDFDPFYAYKAGKFKAAHVTYTSDRIYGIFTVQAIAWRDPPISEEPNATRQVNGRSLDLFYNGTHLHRVLWRVGGITYWITNSYTDYFKNSEMIGIAKSFVPVPAK